MVESYFNQELLDITFEVEAMDEWKQLVSELGIEGQDKVINGDSNSAIPYPFMNTSMIRVYETLCSNKQPYNKYDKTPIPLEVLKQISLSKKENYFQEIEIWSDTKAPDPLVVGMTCKFFNTDVNDSDGKRLYFNSEQECKAHPDFGKTSNYVHKSDEKRYLIARWGDELRVYKELKAIALERKMEEIGNGLQKTLKEAEMKLKLVKENCVSYLNGEGSSYDLRAH